jgi:hypothetical protein
MITSTGHTGTRDRSRRTGTAPQGTRGKIRRIEINILEGINVSKVTPEKKAKFLSVLAEGGSVTQAARAIGVARKTCMSGVRKMSNLTQTGMMQ